MSVTTESPGTPAAPPAGQQAGTEPRRVGGGLLDPKILLKSTPDAFKKLDPRVQLRNPVMFVVEVGSVLTTYSAIIHTSIFAWTITVWLWLTVLFANLAEAVAEGRAKRDPALGPLDVIAHAPLAIGDDVTGLRDLSRPQLALYIGGMGARGRNFYNDLARRFGYEAEAKAIQDAYLDGRRAEAEALVPAELAEQISLIGPEGYVAERLAAFRESGVTTLNVTPLAPTHEARVRLIERIRALAD